MAEKLGKKVICDRCGKDIFLAFVGTKSFDGNYTKTQEFEKLPDDWSFSHDLNMRLCGTCSRKLKDLLDFFKTGDPL